MAQEESLTKEARGGGEGGVVDGIANGNVDEMFYFPGLVVLQLEVKGQFKWIITQQALS